MKKNYEIIKKIQITIIPLHFIFQSEFHNLVEWSQIPQGTCKPVGLLELYILEEEGGKDNY